MIYDIWSRIKRQFRIWSVGVLPGITAIVLIILLRMIGAFQLMEWVSLDFFLRLRPGEATDERVVIVGIDEKDIQRIRAYPIPDHEIAQLLRTLQKYQPRVIGLDIVRDIPVEPGHRELIKTFQENKNIIAVEKVLPISIRPPANLSTQQIGFVDYLSDDDGKVRRSLLGIKRPEDHTEYAFSLSLRLSEKYLNVEGIKLSNGIRDREAMRFNFTELPRFFSHSGGYVGADDFGVQVLLNYRNSQKRFRVLSLHEINKMEAEASNLELLENIFKERIVLIGVTAPSIKDFINTSAIANLHPPGKVYGVEFHAHATSQIISAVLDKRPILTTWSEVWEYFWIIGWGMIALYLGRLTQSPLKNLLYISLFILILLAISYVSLVQGLWIPVAPALLILIINSTVLSVFNQYEQFLKSQIEIRQQTIERTFVVIHNGPLQTLANILRYVQDQELEQSHLLEELRNLNYEIRELGEYLKLEVLAQEESFRLGNGLVLDLKLPMRDLFYEVYSHTIQRNFRCFKTLKVKAYAFDPIEDQYLTLEQKRELCQFLEEVLCNVGKHATGLTRLTALGKENKGWYTLSIKDNGVGIHSCSEGRGTKQCQNIAKKLGGKFKRRSAGAKGTLCELSWPIMRKNWTFNSLKHKIKTQIIAWFRV